jgi:hypothetical protein
VGELTPIDHHLHAPFRREVTAMINLRRRRSLRVLSSPGV